MNKSKLIHMRQYIECFPFAYKCYEYYVKSKNFTEVYWNFYEKIVKQICLPDNDKTYISNMLNNHTKLGFLFFLPIGEYEQVLYELAIKKIKQLLKFYEMLDLLRFEKKYHLGFSDMMGKDDVLFNMFYEYEETYRYRISYHEDWYEKIEKRFCYVKVYLPKKYDVKFLGEPIKANFYDNNKEVN